MASETNKNTGDAGSTRDAANAGNAGNPETRRTAVVVGSGIIGASIALSLARRGCEVIVLDSRSGPAQGSTAATSAIVRFTYSLRDSMALAWESLGHWQRLRDFLSAPAAEPVAELTTNGMAVIETPGLLPPTIREDFAALGIPYADWTAQDLAREIPGIDTSLHFPPLRLDDPAFYEESTTQATALFTPDAGYVSDPVLATENFVRAAQRAGATFRFHSQVVALTEEHTSTQPRWTVELAQGVTVSADIVVNAAGPWSAHVNALAGVGEDHTIGLTPLRQEVHSIPAAGTAHRADGTEVPTVIDPGIGIYVRPETGGQLLIGGTEPDCDPLEWLDSPDDAPLQVTPALFDAQVTRAAKRLSTLSVPNTPRGVVGVYDVATDWTPIYDRSSKAGYYQAVGTSGNQFKNAPVVGELMANLIEAVEAGHDHDHSPLRHMLPRTGHEVDLATFSRRRPPSATSGNVLG